MGEKVLTLNNLKIIAEEVKKSAGGAAGQVYSNPNLIDNPDFRINQRGGNVYYSVGSSTKSHPRAVDRWWVYDPASCGINAYGVFDSKYGNGQQKGVRLSAYKTGNSLSICQEITPELEERLIGRTVTLSVCVEGKVYSLSGVYDPQLSVSDPFGCLPTKWNQLSSANGKAQWCFGIKNCKGAPIAGYDRRCVYVQLNQTYGTDRAYLVVNWVKLELGDRATEFYPPAYNTELLKCQEYCQSFKGELAREYIITNDTIEFRVPMPAPLCGDILVDSRLYDRGTFSVLNNERKKQSGFSFKCRVEKSCDTAPPLKVPTMLVTATKTNHGLSSAILSVENVFMLSTEPKLNTSGCALEEFEQKA